MKQLLPIKIETLDIPRFVEEALRHGRVTLLTRGSVTMAVVFDFDKGQWIVQAESGAPNFHYGGERFDDKRLAIGHACAILWELTGTV